MRVVNEKNIKGWIKDEIRKIPVPIRHSQQQIQRWTQSAIDDYDLTIDKSVVSVVNHGAVADNGTTDNLEAFQDALAEAVAEGKDLYIPPAAQKYGFSDTWNIEEDEVRIFGKRYLSNLYFPNTLGIKLLGQKLHLHDFGVRGSLGGQSDGYNDDTKHGVWMANSENVIERLDIWYFDGDGIVRAGDVGHVPPTNANINHVLFCTSLLNGRHGIRSESGDANAGDCIGLRSDANGRWNIMSKEFLYNRYAGFHIDGGGNQHTLNQTSISHGGNRYFCIKDHTGAADKEPGVSAGWQEYWKLHEAGGVTALYKAWAIDNDYYTGGGLYVEGGGNRSTFDGYAEGNQHILMVSMAEGHPQATITGQIARDGQQPCCIALVDGFIQTLSLSYGAAYPTSGPYKTGYRRMNTGSDDIDYWQCTADAVNELATTWQAYTRITDT